VIDPLAFRQALAQFASGITVVTTRDPEGRPVGLTVSAFCSVSLDPPLILVCVDERSATHDGFEASGRFGVSILAEGQEEVSRGFARGGPEKFGTLALETGPLGTPLVPGALAQLECAIRDAHVAGDHTIYVGEILGLSARPGRPLVYHRGAYRRLDGGADE
jgi:flavin reductase ActVB